MFNTPPHSPSAEQLWNVKCPIATAVSQSYFSAPQRCLLYHCLSRIMKPRTSAKSCPTGHKQQETALNLQSAAKTEATNWFVFVLTLESNFSGINLSGWNLERYPMLTQRNYSSLNLYMAHVCRTKVNFSSTLTARLLMVASMYVSVLCKSVYLTIICVVF